MKGKRHKDAPTNDIFPLKPMLGRAFAWMGQGNALDRATINVSFTLPYYTEI